MFVALGGTSYAAINLPRDSVGKRHLRDRAVGEAELRSRAVTPRTLAPSTRTLFGQAGPQGPAGPAGAEWGQFTATFHPD